MEKMEQNELAALLGGGAGDTLKARLWRLLGERTARYTMGDSSSVTVETAQELERSIVFSLGLYCREYGERELLVQQDWSGVLEQAFSILERLVQQGRELLARVKASSPAVQSQAYIDTLCGVSGFFLRYDLRFFAHRIPCAIDYQLCHALPAGLQGIEYINAYLARLQLENNLCSRFQPGRLKLLAAALPDFYEGLDNLYEQVVCQALCLVLAGRSPFSLLADEEARAALLGLGKGSAEQTKAALLRAAEALCQTLRLHRAAEQDHLFETARELAPRLFSAAGQGELTFVFV